LILILALNNMSLTRNYHSLSTLPGNIKQNNSSFKELQLASISNNYSY
jgi:hypothetical protein